MKTISNVQKGFTLVEVLVALALVSTISLVVMGSLTPWIGMKSKMDTERRLQDIRQGLTAIYESNAMAIEALPDGKFQEFTNSAIDAGSGGCLAADAGFIANADKFSESPQAVAKDGYSNPWCIRVTPALKEIRDGVELWYRNVIVISTGADGKLDPGTTVSANGTLTVGGDDIGITLSGREIQAAKLKETLRRMARVGLSYETYFTARYLANAARDVSIDYFANDVDTGGIVAPTSGTWADTGVALASIGVSGVDSITPWEAETAIQLGNSSESVNGITVRAPTTMLGTLPFTALLRARVPAPAGQSIYALQVVVGNY